MENPIFNPSICIIGAGFSGICAAVKLKKKLGIDSFTIFEEKEDVGGTWLQNSYPGCACDVFGHLYSLSFEQNSTWSNSYPSRNETWSYIKEVVKKHDLVKNIRFKTQVVELKWIVDFCHWQVTTCQKNQKKSTQDFDIIITGSGFLRIPNYPPQFLSFRGPILHSAAWDKNVSLENKSVAVVGSGSSAVQIIPEVAKVAKIVNVYQRSPAWVIPRPQFKFPEIIKTLFSAVPFLMWIFRFYLYVLHEIVSLQRVAGSLMHRFGTAVCSKFLRFQVERQEIVDDLTPNYSYSCKRIGVSEKYYKTFELPHVKLHRKPILKVADDFLETEDGIQKADILILATGFKTMDYFSPMQVFGRDGENIRETWKNNCPSAYYGIITQSAPNMFILLGPNSLLGATSVLVILECQMDYTIKVIEHMMASGYNSVTVKSEFEEQYMADLKNKMKGTVWATDCNSWYKTDKGEVTYLMPWSALWYWWTTRNVNFHHFQFTVHRIELSY